MLKRKRRIPCPVCGFERLIDADIDNKSELKAEKELSDDWIPDYYQKCPRCKNQIAIRKIT